MINIRNGLFETNSSSTHSICVAKKNNYIIPQTLYFEIGEFGWEVDVLRTPKELASYLYTAILDYYQPESKETHKYINYIYKVLLKNNCEAKFEKPQISNYGLMNGYIDHVSELSEILEKIKNSEKFLLKYLFSPDSFIITGNDNDDTFSEIHDKTNFSKVNEFFKGC